MPVFLLGCLTAWLPDLPAACSSRAVAGQLLVDGVWVVSVRQIVLAGWISDVWRIAVVRLIVALISSVVGSPLGGG
ncbi:hypothetical protein CIK69_05315 [Brachybacterium alimentarium]|nr:hypothetical protein CIK69_05315 [Brachybacterium alimentarium]